MDFGRAEGRSLASGESEGARDELSSLINFSFGRSGAVAPRMWNERFAAEISTVQLASGRNQLELQRAAAAACITEGLRELFLKATANQVTRHPYSSDGGSRCTRLTHYCR